MSADSALPQSMHSVIDVPLVDMMRAATGAPMAAYAHPDAVVTVGGGSEREVADRAVCLAVLSAAGLLLMLGWAARRSASARPASDPRPSGAQILTRAPPLRLGLRMADLSVVRR